MTIDEAIQRARDNENIFKNNHKLNLTLKARSPYYGLDCLRISDDNKHLAEWLEELKAYRANEGMSENVYRSGYKFSYNKAVDDCIEEIKNRRNARYMKVNCDDVDFKMLSKKLKGVIQSEDCITSKQKFQRS